MEKKDFGFQYLQYIEKLIEEYLDSIQKMDSDYLNLNGKCVKELLGKRIFNQPLHDDELRELFNSYYLNGILKPNLKDKFYNRAFENFLIKKMELEKNPVDSKSKEIYKAIVSNFKEELKPYKNKIVFYAYGERFLNQVIDILSAINEEVIILSNYNFPETTTCPDNIKIIEYSALEIENIPNDFLKLKFPIFYYLYNTLEAVITALNPKSIIVMEGGNIIDYEILSSIGSKINIKTICLQHGWPCILHTGFRKMPFDYFFTWGLEFSNLFKKVNSKPKFLNTGYPFLVPENKLNKKNAISFFFQAPFFVATVPIIEQMIDFAIFCALSFPKLDILIREHPANQFRSNKFDELKYYNNIQFVPASTSPLPKLLDQSLISVAIFSSTLMESVAYGAIPFVFNLTSMPNYHPNIQEIGLGVEAKTLTEAKEKMLELLEEDIVLKKVQKKSADIKSKYFTMTGDRAITKIVEKILAISNKK